MLMIITITGLPGSGKTSVAKELAKHLHIKYYSMGNIFRKLAKKEHLLLINLMKKKNILWLMDKKQKLIARNHKDAIIDSRLGAYLIKNAKYKIYLYASLRKRAARVVKRDKKTHKEAVNDILSRERKEISYYKKHYNVDYRDKKLYDIILNTEHLTVNQTTREILKKINF